MTPRPTATIRDETGQSLDRDEYATMLAEQANRTRTGQGDRVRVTYGDGSTVEGRCAFTGGDVEGDELITDESTAHPHVTGQVRREVLERTERPRLALLTQGEALAMPALLDELAGVYGSLAGPAV